MALLKPRAYKSKSKHISFRTTYYCSICRKRHLKYRSDIGIKHYCDYIVELLNDNVWNFYAGIRQNKSIIRK